MTPPAPHPPTHAGRRRAELRATYCRAHARSRAAGRYGLALSDADLAEVEERIARGEGVVGLRPDAGAGRILYALDWRGEWRGRWLPVVFDPVARAVVTFLPPEALLPYGRLLAEAEAKEAAPIPAGDLAGTVESLGSGARQLTLTLGKKGWTGRLVDRSGRPVAVACTASPLATLEALLDGWRKHREALPCQP